jgi:hypothetical protein
MKSSETSRFVTRNTSCKNVNKRNTSKHENEQLKKEIRANMKINNLCDKKYKLLCMKKNTNNHEMLKKEIRVKMKMNNCVTRNTSENMEKKSAKKYEYKYKYVTRNTSYV